MAHEIEMRADGTGAAAFALKPAWHGLGIVLDRQITSREALTLVPELNSEVTKEQIVRNGQEVNDRFYTVRKLDDKVLGVVGKKYKVLQNQQALDLLDSLIVGGEASYESIISLRGGATTAMVVNLRDLGVKVGGVDQVDAYGLLSNSHDGSSAVTFAVTPVRVVCANTLAWALSGTKIQYKVQHSLNMMTRMAQVKTILGITQDYMTEFEKDATKLMHQKMSDVQWEEFLGKLVKMPEDAGRGKTIATRKHEELTQVWVHLDETAAEAYKGTAWGAIQAVSHWNQRLATVQAKVSKPKHMSDYEFTEYQERVRAENLFKRTLQSNDSNLTQQAHRLLAVA